MRKETVQTIPRSDNSSGKTDVSERNSLASDCALDGELADGFLISVVRRRVSVGDDHVLDGSVRVALELESKLLFDGNEYRRETGLRRLERGRHIDGQRSVSDHVIPPSLESRLIDDLDAEVT